MRLVLGSASPRRREILAQLGLVFDVIVPAVDETPGKGEGPAVYLRRVVSAKLADVTARAPKGALVLCADTEVVVDGGVLGKASGEPEARAMLEKLSGRAHEVVTVFALRDRVEEVRTTVLFRALDRSEIDAYVASGEWRDKAGAYAIQGFGAMLVSRIEGSYSNVVGLPACEVWVALKKFGAV